MGKVLKFILKISLVLSIISIIFGIIYDFYWYDIASNGIIKLLHIQISVTFMFGSFISLELIKRRQE